MKRETAEAAVVGMCHRCEFRARFKEQGHAPRYECGEDGAVCGCYMYRPVMPVVLRRRDGDKRSVSGPTMLAARCVAKRVADGAYVIQRGKKGEFVVWAIMKPATQRSRKVTP